MSSLNMTLALSPLPRSRLSPSRSGGVNGGDLIGAISKICLCLIYASKERPSSRRQAVLASDAGAREEVQNPRPFLGARNEQELLSFIRKESESGRVSSNVADALEELFYNYRNAVLQSGVPDANEIILSNMSAAFDRILLDVEEPFQFPPHHVAIREPFDYYIFFQNYIWPLIDFRNSYVGNISLFYEIEQKLQQGHNIVLISNHQTEADPAIISLLIERTHSYMAEKMMDDVPELTEMKKRANTRTLKEMALLLRNGSQIIWIAPSGGRDRPDPYSGEWFPAPFDTSSVDNMRRLLEYSNVPGHIYPLALLCYEIMPPPPQVEKQIGERRKLSFHGVGLSVAPEMNFNEIAAGCANKQEAKEAYTEALYNSVIEQYNVLKSAIYGYNGHDASKSIVSLSQPWK